MTTNTETKAVGRIIKVSQAGWGFISSKDIQFTRIFFHWTALRQDTMTFLELKTGMYVEFTPLQIPGKGWRAVHVRVVEKVKPADEQQMPPEDEVSDVSELGPPDDGETVQN